MEKLRADLKKNHAFISVMSLDKPIKYTVTKHPRLKKYVNELDFAYRVFLYCCVLGCSYNVSLNGPGDVIDEVWHAHILHSEQYQFQCNKIFGSYLHHSPVDGDAEKKEESSALLDLMKFLIKKDHKWLEQAIPIIKLFMNVDLIKCSCAKN